MSISKSMNNLEAVMPVAEKDAIKAPIAIEYLIQNTPVSHVYLIANTDIEVANDRITVVDEREVLPVKSDHFEFRSGWIYQQIIKLLQDLTAGDWYIAIDADTFVLSNLQLWEGDDPIFFAERDRRKIAAYDRFNKKFLGYSNYPFQALNNIALYNKNVISEMFNSVGLHNKDSIIDKVSKTLGVGCFPAEAQLYLSWILNAYPELYHVRVPSVVTKGMYDGYKFTKDEIVSTINKHVKSADLLTVHSWDVAPVNYGGKHRARYQVN